VAAELAPLGNTIADPPEVADALELADDVLLAPADPNDPVSKDVDDPKEPEALPVAEEDPIEEAALADEDADAEDPDEPDVDPEEIPLSKLTDDVDDELEGYELGGRPGSPGRPEPITIISVGISCEVTTKPSPSSL